MRRRTDLSYQDVKRELSAGTTRQVYYLRGDEDYLKKDLTEEVIRRVVDPRTKDFNYHPSSAGDLDAVDFASLLSTPPMMYGKRLVHVKDAQRMSTKIREIASGFAATPSPDVILLMVDPRKLQEVPASERSSKFLDTVSRTGGAVVTCWSLFENDLLKWVKESFRRRELTIADEAARFLVEVAGEDLTRLDTEIEKLAIFAVDRKRIQRHDVEQITGRYREDTVFELMHLTAEGRVGDAVRVLGNLRRIGESPVRVIYWFSRHYLELGRALLESTERARRAYFEKRGRKPRGVIHRQLAEAALHDERSVRDSLERIYVADVSIKRDGEAPERALEHLVVDLSMHARERGGR